MDNRPTDEPAPPDFEATGPTRGEPGRAASLRASAQPPTGLIRRDSERIGLALRGALPCVVCKYDLQGLSVRAVCPECGTAVRATILLAVDPRAEALAPVIAPRLMAIGLVAWSVAGLGAIVLCWAPRAAELLTRMGAPVARTWGRPDWLPVVVASLIGVSAIGALALVRPVRRAPALATISALVGALAYAPLLWGVWQVLGRIDRGNAFAYLVGPPNHERIAWRLVIGGGLAVLLAGVRPNARRLVQRSLALRTGRVDRQTILAMVGAVALAALGDLLRLGSGGVGSPGDELIDDLGTILIGLGSLFFTLGAASAVIDSIRIARAIVTPTPTMRQVFDAPART